MKKFQLKNIQIQLKCSPTEFQHLLHYMTDNSYHPINLDDKKPFQKFYGKITANKFRVLTKRKMNIASLSIDGAYHETDIGTLVKFSLNNFDLLLVLNSIFVIICLVISFYYFQGFERIIFLFFSLIGIIGAIGLIYNSIKIRDNFIAQIQDNLSKDYFKNA